MGGVTLVSTFYSFEPFVAAAHAYSPTKIVLVVAKDSLPKVEPDLAKVKQLYGSVASIETLKVDDCDLLSIAKDAVKLLEGLKGRAIVNVSGGWKLLAQGVLYGCYARPELVEKIVCNNLVDNSLVELPKLTYGLTSSKLEVLEEIAKRNNRPIAEIAAKLEKTPGMLYQHLKELKDAGYVNEEFEITLAGRLALM